MVRRWARHLVVSHTSLRRCGASRRAIAASLRRRAALSDVPFRLASGSKLRPLLGGRVFRASGKPHGPPSASSSRGVVVPPGGTPAPPERRRSVRLLPAGAASCSIIKTPLDDALTRAGRTHDKAAPTSGDKFPVEFCFAVSPMQQRDAATRKPTTAVGKSPRAACH